MSGYKTITTRFEGADNRGVSIHRLDHGGVYLRFLGKANELVMPKEHAKDLANYILRGGEQPSRNLTMNVEGRDGVFLTSAEFELIVKGFDHLRDNLDRLTPGNMSHHVAGMRGSASLKKEIMLKAKARGKEI